MKKFSLGAISCAFFGAVMAGGDAAVTHRLSPSEPSVDYRVTNKDLDPRHRKFIQVRISKVVPKRPFAVEIDSIKLVDRIEK